VKNEEEKERIVGIRRRDAYGFGLTVRIEN
jgi:hypothetical protein